MKTMLLNQNLSARDRLVLCHPEISKIRRGLPNTGQRLDGEPFYHDVKVIDDMFRYSNSLYDLEGKIDLSLRKYNAGAGSPMKTSPFPPISKALCEVSDERTLSQYQLAAGDPTCRETIASFLSSEGFSYGIEKKIGAENIIFTNSTTEAFDFIIKLIARPFDVVIFVGPTYGLFTYIPERNNAISKILPLASEDDWLINPEKLKVFIDDTNARLRNLAAEKKIGYLPCVCAFVNINPSNPTGRVMGKEHILLLKRIHEVCKERGVWIIDDIIYRELVYSRDKVAIAMSSIEGLNDNIITLLGPSKSYGVAGLRAGMIVAEDIVIRGIRSLIFQHMDSTSLAVGRVLQACYSNGEDIVQEKTAYFESLCEDYRRKWILTKALIEGINSIDEEYRHEIVEYVKTVDNECWESILKPTDDIKIAGEIYPESGFFVLLDFTGSKGKTYRDITINSERDVLLFYYLYSGVKLLMGNSIGWPNKEEFIGRVTFGLEDSDIVIMLKQMKDAANLLNKR